jgi:hypothetical protein
VAHNQANTQTLCLVLAFCPGAKFKEVLSTVIGFWESHRNLPRYEPPAEPPTGDLVTLKRRSLEPGSPASTLHRWINDGFIAGEQFTPGAPWRIRLTDELRAHFVEQTPPGHLPMLEATMKLGISGQQVHPNRKLRFRSWSWLEKQRVLHDYSVKSGLITQWCSKTRGVPAFPDIDF